MPKTTPETAKQLTNKFKVYVPFSLCVRSVYPSAWVELRILDRYHDRTRFPGLGNFDENLIFYIFFDGIPAISCFQNVCGS